VHNEIQTNQRIKFVLMGLNVSIKLFLDIISLLEEVFEKPSSFFRIMVIIKISFEKSFVYNKMLF
jgi:hypothetical protein